jgi:hypothetical protein
MLVLPQGVPDAACGSKMLIFGAEPYSGIPNLCDLR